MSEAPKRVRVTADAGARRAVASGRGGTTGRGAPVTRGIALPGSAVDEADAVYARALMRTQLRLALGTVAGFVIVMVALAAVIALIPVIDEIILAGIPLSWLLQAFAFYPVILLFAVLYARGAARNEARYRALRERE